MLTLILAILLSPPTITDAQRLSVEGDYEASAEILKTVKPDRDNQATYFYLMAVNSYALEDKVGAEKWLDRLEGAFRTEIPERYLGVAHAIRADIAARQEGGMHSIERKMKMIKDRLANAKGGPKTQALQKKVLFDLEELIKELEDDQKKKDQQAKGGEGEDKKKVKGQGEGQGNPMDDSQIAGDSGPGNVTEKKIKDYQKNWGTMPQAERARAMEDITRDLPPRYKEVIENYFKAMSKHGRNSQP